jgi:hypothetical protein
MALIDASYFIGEINIPSTGAQDVAQRLGLFIEQYEPQLLRDVLGYPLYKAFAAGLAAGSPDQRWVDLRDGKEYPDYSGYTQRWDGILIKKSPTVLKQSMIANFVYWHWMRNQVSISTNIGEVAPASENSIVITPASKMVRAWNQMIDWICQMHEYLQINETTYPEWTQRNNYFQMRNYRKQNIIGI